MRIVDLLKKDAVALNAKVSSKDEMLDLLIDLHEKVGNIADKAGKGFQSADLAENGFLETRLDEGRKLSHLVGCQKGGPSI